MKKILISVAILILIILLYITIANSLQIGNFKIESYKGIKEANGKMNQKFEEADRSVGQTYNQKGETLNTAITELKDTKEQYDSQVQYNEARKYNFIKNIHNRTFRC